MKKLIRAMLIVLGCITMSLTVSADESAEDSKDVETQGSVINDIEDAQNLEDICNYLDATEKELEKDQEEKIAEVLLKADSYSGYVDNYQVFKDFYSEMANNSESFYNLFKEGAIAFYKMITATVDLNDYDSWNDAMDEFYECFDDSYDDYYEYFVDLYDDLYEKLDDVISEAFDTEEYSEVSDAWSTMYNDWSESWETMYSMWSDSWGFQFSFYSEVWSELFSGSYDIDAALAKAEEDNKETAETSETVETGLNDAFSSEEISEEFRAAMDDYEEFFDEYVELTQKISENPSDPDVITEYAEFMTKYAETMSSFEAWEDKTMNDAEKAYYAEVSLRISQKLLDTVGEF